MPIVPQVATATTVTTAVDDDGGDSVGASSKGNLEQYPLSVISGLAEQTVVSTRAKVDPRSGPF